jgi:hypothetical protein
LKKKKQKIRRLFCQDFGLYGDRKIKHKVLLTQKLVFDTKHLSNTIETMINLPMTSKNHPKNQTQPQTKNQLELRYVFSRTFKEQKHLI